MIPRFRARQEEKETRFEKAITVRGYQGKCSKTEEESKVPSAS